MGRPPAGSQGSFVDIRYGGPSSHRVRVADRRTIAARRRFGRSNAAKLPRLIPKNPVSRRRPLGWYDVLGAHPFASRDDLKAAYHKRLLESHTDKNPKASCQVKAAMTKRLVDVREAWSVLGNASSRADYDAKLGIGRPTKAESTPRVRAFRARQAVEDRVEDSAQAVALRCARHQFVGKAKFGCECTVRDTQTGSEFVGRWTHTVGRSSKVAMVERPVALLVADRRLGHLVGIRL